MGLFMVNGLNAEEAGNVRQPQGEGQVQPQRHILVGAQGGINQVNLRQRNEDVFENNTNIIAKIEGRQREIDMLTANRDQLREQLRSLDQGDPGYRNILQQVVNKTNRIKQLRTEKHILEQRRDQALQQVDFSVQMMQTETLKADLSEHNIPFDKKSSLSVLNDSTIDSVTIDFGNKQTQGKKSIFGKESTGYLTTIEYTKDGETKTIKALVDFNDDKTFKEMHHYREE